MPFKLPESDKQAMKLKRLFTIFFVTVALQIYALHLINPQHNGNSGFLENKGQIIDNNRNPRQDIIAVTRSKGVQVFIGKQGLHYLFAKADTTDSPTANPKFSNGDSTYNENIDVTTFRLDVHLVGSNPTPSVEYEDATAFYENYYLAHCPEGITGVRTFKKIILKDVYPGIDWVFYQHGEFMKYDFVAQPGADISLIQLQFDGATKIQKHDDGSILISTPLGSITEKAPLSTINKEIIPSSFQLRDNLLSFELEQSETDSIIIDPIIEWSTYYGYGVSESSNDIDTDSTGNIYMAGVSQAITHVSSGGHQNTHAGLSDGLLVKFDSTGQRLWATYYGGAGIDRGNSCSTDPQQNIYLAGTTTSLTAISSNGHQMQRGNPTSPHPYTYDAFLVKFAPNGTRLWGTYYGGDANENGSHCGTDAQSNVFLIGSTGSSNNIASNGFMDTLPNLGSAFMVKFNSSGSRLWGTYFGGNLINDAISGEVDKMGNTYLYGQVVGNPGDTGLAYNGFQNSLQSQTDLYVAKFSPSGARLWSSYFGGPAEEKLFKFRMFNNSCALDKQGNLFITGTTQSSTGIATGGMQQNYQGAGDCFLARISAGGSLLWATYFGGPYEDLGFTCTVDGKKRIYLAGHTISSQGIAWRGFQNYLQGPSDGFLAQYDYSGKLIWCTYVGGEDDDKIVASTTDFKNNIYLGGDTESSTGIAFKGFQNNHLYGPMGKQSAFLMKFKGCSTNRLDTIHACESYYWPIQDTIFTTSGMYSDTLVGPQGCDTLVQLYLNIHKATQRTQTITTCDEYLWPANGKMYHSNASDTAFLQSIHGCDSVVILNLTIKHSSTSTLIETACIQYISPSGQHRWTKSGLYTDIIRNRAGCDSIITIHLQIKDVDTEVTQTDSTLTAHAIPATFQWLKCTNGHEVLSGQTKSHFVPIFNGRYAVRITQNGCTDTSACFTISDKESIDNPFGIRMSIYPNPTTGVVHVQFSDVLQGVNATIWTTAGKLIWLEEFGTTAGFDLEIPWPKAVYYLKISISSGKSVIAKLVKE